MRESFHHLKWILLAVVAAFIIGFVYVDMGLGGAQQRTPQDRSYAARVNGDTITFAEYNRALYFAEQNYRQMYGDQFTQQLEDQMGVPRQVLESLVDQRLMLQQAAKLHLTASPEEVQKKILSLPMLNPNGKFVGTDLYERYIHQVGYQTAADFEDELAREITVEKMESALANSVVVSPKAAEAEYRRTAESAKIRYALYSASREMANVNVTPAEVDAFYKANQEKYAHGEQREMKYLVSDMARIRSQIVAPEAQVRAKYDAGKNTEFAHPEQAHILHILIKVNSPAEDAAAKAKADALVKQLRGGADFAALAKANSQDPSSSGNGGDMGWIDRGATVEPFDTAAFMVPLNTISDPIRSKEYGYHIIKVLERRAAGPRPYEEVRGQIAAQLAQQMAKDQAQDEINKIAARMKAKKPATPAEFTSYANDKVSSNDTQWFAKGDMIPGLGANQAMATWAFNAKQGDVSDVIGTQRGPTLAYLGGIRAAGVAPLEDIRERVTNDAKLAKARDLARQHLAAAIAGAPNVDAVAAKVGLTAADTTINRQGYVSGIPGDTSALVDAVMSTPPGVVKGPIVAGDGAVVFQVIEQKKVTPDELAKTIPSYIDNMRQRDARNLRTSLLQRLRKSSSIDINDRAVTQGQSQQNDQQS
ncbi:MAG TPA: SurA N-terminal domain-containing protein [Thermoanaerobaculia bacterium]|nr:SurA N-terminal domain-containing protein [Thermoanaerobaculia bacterium]